MAVSKNNEIAESSAPIIREQEMNEVVEPQTEIMRDRQNHNQPQVVTPNMIVNIVQPKSAKPTPFLNRSRPGGQFVKVIDGQHRFVDAFGKDLGSAE